MHHSELGELYRELVEDGWLASAAGPAGQPAAPAAGPIPAAGGLRMWREQAVCGHHPVPSSPGPAQTGNTLIPGSWQPLCRSRVGWQDLLQRERSSPTTVASRTPCPWSVVRLGLQAPHPV